MQRSRVKRGDIVQADRPDWRPLENLVGEPVVADFMWMFEVALTDGSCLQAYKHIDTRRYVHLDGEGTAFVYEAPDRYRVWGAAELLEAVFVTLPRLAGVTREQIDASAAAVERARRAGRER